ncbi:MAG: hypothetical protein ACLQD8_01495 [Thermoplasmata archaeon]
MRSHRWRNCDFCYRSCFPIRCECHCSSPFHRWTRHPSHPRILRQILHPFLLPSHHRSLRPFHPRSLHQCLRPFRPRSLHRSLRPFRPRSLHPSLRQNHPRSLRLIHPRSHHRCLRPIRPRRHLRCRTSNWCQNRSCRSTR